MKNLKWWQVIIFIFVLGYFRGCLKEETNSKSNPEENNSEISSIQSDVILESDPYENYPFLFFGDAIIAEFNSIKLDTNYTDWEGGVPKYTTYYADHIKLLRKIDSSFVRDSVSGYSDSLYIADKKSVIDSMMNTKNVKSAFKNVIYGDCGYYDILLTVEEILKRTANDPKSISVQSLSLGKNLKDGIQVIVSYRGKNKFGALVLDEITLVLKNKPRAIRDINQRWYSYDAYDDDYEVISAY